MSKINILIADDHKLIRETWSYILNSDARFQVIAECGDAQEGSPGFAAWQRGSRDTRGRFDQAGTNSTKSDEVGAEDVSLARSPIKTGQECRSEARTNGASDAGYKRGLMQWPAKARE